MSAEHRTSAWTKARARVKPLFDALVASGQAWCWDGKHPIDPTERWDVSHIVGVAEMKAAGVPESEWHLPSNLTISCYRHNRGKGGAVGAAMTKRKRRSDKRVAAW